ncbi:eukaryotic translation initiation factor 3 subunit A-like [Amphiprion ocellaris]|uniref:eukaryotic translation initiation factor 3 subunit A-like n=1 Tax=Amphiprion ocellaris TaxID=80972 RepID=UPI0024113A39|nr:eukaryotic translation initiation factor 3 subunit A-like [Amphiprion ocellaris]
MGRGPRRDESGQRGGPRREEGHDGKRAAKGRGPQREESGQRGGPRREEGHDGKRAAKGRGPQREESGQRGELRREEGRDDQMWRGLLRGRMRDAMERGANELSGGEDRHRSRSCMRPEGDWQNTRTPTGRRHSEKSQHYGLEERGSYVGK